VTKAQNLNAFFSFFVAIFQWGQLWRKYLQRRRLSIWERNSVGKH